MSRDRFDFGFKLSDHIVITPKFRPALGYSPSVEFPWFLDVAPIDYQSRLEAELIRFWGSFDTHEENDAAVGEVDGIEIRRSVTVYRRVRTG